MINSRRTNDEMIKYADMTGVQKWEGSPIHEGREYDVIPIYQRISGRIIRLVVRWKREQTGEEVSTDT